MIASTSRRRFLAADRTGLLFATCAITGTELKDVVRPMAKYLAVLFVAPLVLKFVPAFSLWLPARVGFG